MYRPSTIKDIAKLLNISVSTVSRALRDKHDVSPETRNKVLEAARKIQYRPNYNATALAKRGSHNIGVVLPYIDNYYFSTVIKGIQEVAYTKAYNIILFVTNDSPQREVEIIRDLSPGNFDGLLVSTCCIADSYDHFAGVMNQGVPVVFFDRVPEKIKTSKVVQDDFNGAFEAVKHLVNQGYRRIAHITGPKGLLFTQRRYEGYAAALSEYGLTLQNDYVTYSNFTQESGEIDCNKLLSLPQPPDAIFAANDRKAIGAMLAIKKMGRRIGPDIGVIGFTNDPMSQIISPSLSTVAEPALGIGKECCELLLKHIQKKNFIPEERVLPAQLIIRESTRRG